MSPPEVNSAFLKGLLLLPDLRTRRTVEQLPAAGNGLVAAFPEKLHHCSKLRKELTRKYGGPAASENFRGVIDIRLLSDNRLPHVVFPGFPSSSTSPVSLEKKVFHPFLSVSHPRLVRQPFCTSLHAQHTAWNEAVKAIPSKSGVTFHWSGERRCRTDALARPAQR
jgi:hypothetical protein